MGIYKYIQTEIEGVKSFKKTYIEDKSDVILAIEKEDREEASLGYVINYRETDLALFLSDITEESPERTSFADALTVKIDKYKDRKIKSVAKLEELKTKRDTFKSK